MPSLQESIHAPHVLERNAVIAALDLDTSLQKRANRMKDCGSHGRLYLEGYPPEVRLWVHRCGDRLCPLCSLYRGRQIADQLRALMLGFKTMRHMVLTVQNAPQGKLAESLSHLRASFARLRKMSGWKERVRGGAYIVEITRSKKDGSWHPHLHIIFEGEYFRQQVLSALWANASDGSTIVWVGMADKRHANYLAKYAGKPADLRGWKPAEIQEYARCTGRSRMVQTFGSMHGLKLEDRDSKPEPSNFRSSITLKQLVQAALTDHPGAVQMCKVASRRWPRLWQYLRIAAAIPPPTVNWEEREDLGELDNKLTDAARLIMELTFPEKAAMTRRPK